MYPACAQIFELLRLKGWMLQTRALWLSKRMAPKWVVCRLKSTPPYQLSGAACVLRMCVLCMLYAVLQFASRVLLRVVRVQCVHAVRVCGGDVLHGCARNDLRVVRK